ncbi:hypothetical protein HY251_20200, partial [bacterium]|nr:hypothetical protein [bacterium]
PRLLAGGIFAAVALGLGLRSSFERAAFAAIACVVFLSPVVHPWYVLWLVPFLAWRRSAAWLELTLAVSVVYAARIVYDGSKESWLGELRWPRLLWMGGFVAIALLGPILGGSVRGRGVSRAAL